MATIKVYVMGEYNTIYEGDKIRLARNRIMNYEPQKKAQSSFDAIFEDIMGIRFDIIVGTKEYLGVAPSMAIEVLNALGHKSVHDE